MRTTRALGLAAVLAATALVAPNGASAASPVTVSGEFAGQITYVGCTPPAATTSGDWSITLHGTSAKGFFDILVNEEPHLTYTFPGMKLAPGSTASSFVASGRTAAGLLTVTVTPSVKEYKIAPYHYGDLTCDSVTYPLTLDE